jgi:energy-coupling factor transport system ATP-binding protein
MNLRIRNLTVSYRPGDSDSRPAIEDLSLDIDSGEYVAVLGANGSGKSTFVSCINGLLKPPPGSVLFSDGRSPGLDSSNEADLEAIRRLCGTVMQNPEDQIIATVVEEDAAFGPSNMGLPLPEVKRRVDASLSVLGLEALCNRSVETLSDGEKQRLALAGVLAMEPQFLLLDEAASMIDPRGRSSFLNTLDTLNGLGKTIITVTHSLEEALRAKRSVVLHKGRLEFDGSATDLLQRPEIADWGFRTISVNPLNAQKSAPFSPSPPLISFNVVSHRDRLHGITLSIPRGATVALIGKSGAGKSTLLKHINALLLPDNGSVSVDGKDTRDKKTPLRDFRFISGLAVQNPENALFESYVADDTAYGPQNKGLRGDALRNCVASALSKSGLPPEQYMERETANLSGGEKRRVAIAGVLALDSPVLLLDEASAALDGQGRETIASLIAQSQACGKTVIAATHSMEEAARFDFVAVIAAGRLAAFGPSQEILAQAWDGLTANLSGEGIGVRLGEKSYSSPLGGLFGWGVKAASSALRSKTELDFFNKPGLGQYVDKDSALRRLPPLVKLLALLALTLAALALPHAAFPLGVLILVLIAASAFGGMPLKGLLRRLLRSFPLLLLITLIQILFSWNGDASRVYFAFGWFNLTEAELSRSFSLAARLLAMLSLFTVYTTITPLRETMNAIKRLLAPLKRIGLPAGDAAMTIMITLRSIPVLSAEAERILTAQLSRGAGKGKIRSALAMVLPLFLRTLERSEKLAQAMMLRLYRPG